MILDRTGSMSSTDLSNERTAANALTNLYAGVTPAPKVGAGSIGAYPNAALPAGAANINSLAHLGASFSNVLTALANITGSNSSVGSNLGAGINAGESELATNGTASQKVLVFVSDGEPTEPSGAVANATGFFLPTGNAADAGSSWINPVNAQSSTDASANASSTIASVARERYQNFTFPTIPSSATITGIEAQVAAWATTPTLVATPTSIQKAPSISLGAPNNQWANPNNAFASDNVYVTDSTNGHTEGYGNFGFSIPANATITGIQVSTEAKVTGFGGSTPTATLFPNGQGSDSNWNGTESDIDETGTVSCANNENINSNANGNRESVNLDLSSIPDGSNVTNVPGSDVGPGE